MVRRRQSRDRTNRHRCIANRHGVAALPADYIETMSYRLRSKTLLIQGVFLLGISILALFQVGCKTPAPPLPPPAQVVAPAPVPEVRIDDIPADAPPAVRGHLIKLREMRDLGQITDGDYQSRKALLLGR